MKKILNQDVGILILRVVVGVVFVVHGWDKFFHIKDIIGFFGSVGIPFPHFTAYFVATIEFFGGIAILLGAFTWLVGLLFAIIMLVVIFSVKGTSHLIGIGGYEYELVLLGASLALAKIHPGKYSVMRSLKKENQIV